ncbi:MAG: hypothetical protein WD004_04905 [Actinomycetota bacterium]
MNEIATEMQLDGDTRGSIALKVQVHHARVRDGEFAGDEYGGDRGVRRTKEA